MMKKYFSCHPERSEGSQLRFLATLGMTLILMPIVSAHADCMKYGSNISLQGTLQVTQYKYPGTTDVDNPALLLKLDEPNCVSLPENLKNDPNYQQDIPLQKVETVDLNVINKKGGHVDPALQGKHAIASGEYYNCYSGTDAQRPNTCLIVKSIKVDG